MLYCSNISRKILNGIIKTECINNHKLTKIHICLHFIQWTIIKRCPKKIKGFLAGEMANMTIGGINLIVTNNVKMDAISRERLSNEVILEIEQILNNNLRYLFDGFGYHYADTVNNQIIKTGVF